jgi:regulator of sirC expression with transglutaminase-like and TPR domain
MKLRTIASNASDRGGFQSEHSIIRVYRRHAARAISEERWQVAEIFFDRILDISPDLTEAWLMKGLLRQYCLDDEHAAARCFRKVLDLCRDNPSHPHAEKARASLAQLLAA